MKKTILGILLSCWLAGFATAGTLTDAEAEKLKADIAMMLSSFEQGNAEVLIEKTHPSLPSLIGSDIFAQLIRQSVEGLRQSGVKFISSETGSPTQTYIVDDEELCFVPRVSVMELNGKKMRSYTFMVAIRKIGDNKWTYIDGAGLRKNPTMLYLLFPQLPSDISFPLNMLEVL